MTNANREDNAMQFFEFFRKLVNSEMTLFLFHELFWVLQFNFTRFFPCFVILQKTRQFRAGNVSTSRDFYRVLYFFRKPVNSELTTFQFHEIFPSFLTTFRVHLQKPNKFHEFFRVLQLFRKSRQFKADNSRLFNVH